MSEKAVAEALKKPFPLRDEVFSEIEVFGVINSDKIDDLLGRINLKKDEKIAIIVSDILRCSTTILSAFAQGSKAISVVNKSNGLKTDVAESIGDILGLETVTGGELFGKPIPGGVIRNSPMDIQMEKLDGRHLFFLSSNLGSLLDNVATAIEANELHGKTEIILGSYANLDTISKYIANRFSRFVIMPAGLKNNIALEDMHFSGKLIHEAGKSNSVLDAEAHLMLAAYKGIKDIHSSTSKTPSGQTIIRMGMAEDIDVCLNPEKLPANIRHKMKNTLPKAKIINRIAVFTCT